MRAAAKPREDKQGMNERTTSNRPSYASAILFTKASSAATECIRLKRSCWAVCFRMALASMTKMSRVDRLCFALFQKFARGSGGGPHDEELPMRLLSDAIDSMRSKAIVVLSREGDPRQLM